MNRYLDIAPEVQQAVAEGRPVVALESTIISHGMPYPKNVETALLVEQTIRDYASNFGMTDRSVPLENLKEMMGLSDEVVENNIRPAAEFQVKTDLLLDKIKDEEKLEVTEEAFNEYLNKVAEDVKATADQLKNYFGEAFIKAEQLKEMATNLIVDSAKVKAAEAEEKPKKARKPKTPKADDKAEETEAAAEEPKAE